MSEKPMPTLMQVIIAATGMTMRADADSRNSNLPKDQRTFHAGRREGCLKMLALLTGHEVKDIRFQVLGTRQGTTRYESS